MDILSHALWAGAAATAMHQFGLATRRDIAGAAALGAMPDLLGMIPVTLWAATQAGTVHLLHRWVTAHPGAEPALAPWARMAEHHLHCSGHSLVVAGLATLLVWRFAARFMPWLLGWWLHIAIDVPTHSDEFYPVPIFYPFSDWGVDGIAWTNPGVLVVNYLALTAVYALLWVRRARDP